MYGNFFVRVTRQPNLSDDLFECFLPKIEMKKYLME